MSSRPTARRPASYAWSWPSCASRSDLAARAARAAPIALAAALAAALAGCAPRPVAGPSAAPTPALVRVLATDLTEPLLLDLGGAYAGANRDVALVPEQVAADALPADLSAGRADLGLTVAPGPGLFATPLGYVRLTVVVHPENPLSQLDLAQVQALFAGQATDWAEAGGAPGPVQPVVRPPGSDAAQLFAAQALNGAAPGPIALVAPTWGAMLELVAQTPGAIGYLPEFAVDASVKRVRLPVELRALIVAVALAEPSGPPRDFLAWAQSAPGQAVVAQRHEPVR